jgi:two-component system, OmpR family, KDP operon response regulator KdpE
MNELPLVLIIDDEKQIRRLLEITLGTNGFRTIAAETGDEGLRIAAMNHPDLILLDLGLPDKDGMEVLRNLREWASVPIIILSVRNTEQDIISALDSGADDYLTKPFRTGELLARVRTALRHMTGPESDVSITFGALELNLANHTIKRNNEPVKLTSKEFTLLALFVKNPGKVLTHRYLLEQVWGHAYAEETQYTRVFVSQLRKKLEEDPSRPRYLVTESGIGYRFMGEDVRENTKT